MDNGMLTQTLKLIRRNIMKKYGERLRGLLMITYVCNNRSVK